MEHGRHWGSEFRQTGEGSVCRQGIRLLLLLLLFFFSQHLLPLSPSTSPLSEPMEMGEKMKKKGKRLNKKAKLGWPTRTAFISVDIDHAFQLRHFRAESVGDDAWPLHLPFHTKSSASNLFIFLLLLYCLNRREKKTSPKRQGLVGNSFFFVCITNRERRSGRQFVWPIRLMLWLNACMMNIRSGKKKKCRWTWMNDSNPTQFYPGKHFQSNSVNSATIGPHPSSWLGHSKGGQRLYK